MVRYPYTLEMWYEDDATYNPVTGDSIEGFHEWRTVGRCNARQNGQARVVRGANGESLLYSYEITMPHSTPPIPLNTDVRVLDRNGINIFDYKSRNDDNPDSGTSRTYEVQGFYKSGQPNQDVTIWL